MGFLLNVVGDLGELPGLRNAVQPLEKFAPPMEKSTRATKKGGRATDKGERATENGTRGTKKHWSVHGPWRRMSRPQRRPQRALPKVCRIILDRSVSKL